MPMKVNGIVAEYNPFHNGHKYHIEKSKELTGADYTVVVMSGNFVQRGTPALTDKFSRTNMALLNGADLVLELPSIYACASAEYFATASVSLLTKLGVISHLSFGSESGDIKPFQRAAEILYNEPEAFSDTLRYYLRRGMTYPTARLEALIQYDHSFASCSHLFHHPNNILGIEYIKALLRLGDDITPVTILRSGSSYHDPNPGIGYCSALAIRQSIREGKQISDLKDYIPASTMDILSEIKSKQGIVSADDLSTLLYYKLQMEPGHNYSRYMDVSADLSDRIHNRLSEFTTFKAFCDALKTKELTHTRISRSLLHILLNITSEDLMVGRELGYTPYARVLGFKREAAPLLHAIKQNCCVPFITKLADAHRLLEESALSMLKQDIQISQFYYGMIASRTQSPVLNEITVSPVIL